MNIKREYLSRFRKAIPKSLPQKKAVLKQMELTIDEYLEVSREATLESLLQDLGTPEEAAFAYLENQVSDELRYVRRKQWLLVSIIFVFFLSLFSVGIVYVYQYWPTITIYETAAEYNENTP